MTTAMPPDLLFDLDGTLIDSSAGILGSFERVLAMHGLAPAEPLTAALIGPPLAVTLRQVSGLGETGDDALLGRLVEAFKADYDSEGYRATTAFPGVADGLAQLAGAGSRLFILTNKRLLPSRRILDALGLARHFAGIHSRDETEPPAPSKAAVTRRVIGQHRIDPARACIVGASYGVLYESSHIVLRRVRIAIAGLPKALWGFRIGHVTDIHISRFQTQLRHLERGLELLAQEKLDLMCPTGDLCDEPRLHLDTLRLIKQVPARLGHIACVGNHELYLADPLTIARAYDKAQIQLLEEESVLVGGLRLSGVGFAHSAKVPRLDERLVPRQLEAALRDRRTGEPTILLAHHPHVFRHVTGKEVMLQLSGHTHGGQVGLFGHAILEPVYPLIRGHYRAAKDSAQLFVSAGLGHWLPFRFGCPPEVVVIELVPA